MKTNNECPKQETVIKFRKMKWSVGRVVRTTASVFCALLCMTLIILDYALIGTLLTLLIILFNIYNNSNIFKNFRSNSCPITPLIINERGISYVEHDRFLFLFDNGEKNIFIKWDDVEDINDSYGYGLITNILYDYVKIKMRSTDGHEKEPVNIDVTYADCKPKKIVSIMQDYLQKHRTER